ncbi:MAG: prolipoprotein diacylglyceryl transferase [Chloroflexi bacterium]|nr:prolipoprotein diacylglyceryl transferase [Chloroflexota bacterium]
MIDPVIFSFKLLGNIVITLRWYGVLVMLGAVVGAWIAEKEIKRRGENGETIWDALVWVLPIGIIGARLWYVMNSILGGSRYYLDDPIRILYISEGGLHFFGGLLFGAVTLLIFLRRKKMDTWLFLDAIAPVTLIGQAIARPANFINQELYGQPTQLPWGIPIDAEHRIAPYADLGLYPVESTRFHPTFAYEMIWNFLAALFLLWYARQYKESAKPGTIFGGWLVLAGIGRAIIEFFRPDQPLIPGTIITYSAAVSLLMAVAGAIILLVRYGRIHLAFAEGWEDEYQIPEPEKMTRAQRVVEVSAETEEEEELVKPKRRPAKKRTASSK